MTAKTNQTPTPEAHLLNLRSSIEKLKADADATRVSMDDMSGADKVKAEMRTMKAQMRLQQAESNYLEALRFYASLDMEDEESGLDYDALREIHKNARKSEEG